MYTMVELGHIGSSASSIPMAISDPTTVGPVIAGESFSSFSSPTLSWRAVVWRPNVSLIPIDLLTIGQAGNNTVNRAGDVSPSGQYIVGYSNVNPPHGVRWTFNPESGAVTDIDVLSPWADDGASEGVGINSSGRAAGYSLSDSSTTRGVTWAPGSSIAVLLPAPPGSGGFRLAREISELPEEHIVGRCDMSSTPTTRPIIWKKSGGVYGTGELMELLSGNTHDAVGITPNGQMAVGLGATATEARGVGWDTTTNDVIDLGGLCCSQNVVFDMNNDEVGVGYIGEAFDVFRAVLYWEGQAYNLNDRIVNNPEIGNSLFLHVATGINSEGKIVGKFGGFASGEPLTPGRVFLLTPVPVDTPGDVNGDGVVDIDDLFEVIGAWGDCPDSPALCPADVDDTGIVDIDDLFTVIGNWS
jgi:hypothetical protein